MEAYGDFFAKCVEAREFINKYDSYLLVHHYDADGLSAGAIISHGLEKYSKNYERLCVRKLGPNEIDYIKNSKHKNVILVDLGSGAVDELKDLDKNILIIDHHQGKSEGLLQVNPRYHNIDGSREMSGSSATYFVINDPKLSSIGIVGSVGDMQFPLVGPNRIMLKQGINAGVVRAYKDLSMFGRLSRPLVTFISTSLDPYLPGLTGDEHAVAEFFESININLKKGDKWRTYNDLSEEEKVRLRSAIVIYLCLHGRCNYLDRLFSEVYELLDYPLGTEMRDAKEFSTLLNACGRHGKPEKGIDTLLKKPGSYESARKLLEYHRKIIRVGIEYAIENALDFGLFYFIDGRGVIPSSVIGIVAGMLYGSLDYGKPVLAISLDSDKNIKMSGRGNNYLIEKGLNLGKIFHKIAPKYGGIGGGHDVAAGATIKNSALDDFMLEFGDNIYEQIYS